MSILPESTHDGPAVAASRHLELVCDGERDGRPVSQPDHVGGVFLLAPHPLQGAVQPDRFPQGRDNMGGTALERQIFEHERETAGMGVRLV